MYKLLLHIQRNFFPNSRFCNTIFAEFLLLFDYNLYFFIYYIIINLLLKHKLNTYVNQQVKKVNV